MLRNISIRITIGLLSLSPITACAADYTLSPVADGMQLKAPNGKVVLEYKTKKPEGLPLTAPSAAYFDPINTPSGERVTNAAPDDHPHHRGMWLGFLDSQFHTPSKVPDNDPPNLPKPFNVTRADFYGWGFWAPRENRIIQNRDVKLVKADATHAELEIANDWTVEGKKMLDETEHVNVAERDGVYVIDVTYRIAPVVDYLLPQQAFGGFTVQGQKAGEYYYSDSSGKVSRPSPHYSVPDRDWAGEPWYDYTIKLKSDGKTVGFAVVDHPSNPPTRWHNVLWFLNPVITSYGPTVIHPDKPLELHYRVVVHDGDTPTAVIEKLSKEFRGGK